MRSFIPFILNYLPYLTHLPETLSMLQIKRNII